MFRFRKAKYKYFCKKKLNDYLICSILIDKKDAARKII